MRRRADEIIEEMRGLAKSDDPEGAHSQADELLCEGLLSLAGYCDEKFRAMGYEPPESVILRGRRLVRAWNAVEKWYA